MPNVTLSQYFPRFLKRGSLLFLTLFLFGIGSELAAQTMMPLPPYSSTYTSSQVRGYWFQAPTDFRIVGVRVPTDVGTAAQNIQVFKMGGNRTQICQWPTTTTNYTTLGVWYNVASTAMIPCDILVQTGDYIGIVGARGSNGGTLANSYDGTSPQSTNIFGLPVSLTRFGHQGSTFPITGGVWTEPYTVCRIEMYYTSAVTGPNDAGVYSIDSPVNYCDGQEDVVVTMKNFGTNQVTSATINWTLNGTPQPAYNWTGMLDTLNFNTRQTQVTLASNMTSQSGVPYTITACTSMPNGVADTVTSNDSASVTVQAAIAGTFTIGGASPDYATFTDAANALVANGVCGPVVFNVRSGTYNEQVTLTAIAGVSAINTITFQSESGNRADVNLTYGASSTANNWVLKMGTAEFVTFRNMTMTATGSSYSIVVDQDASTDCTIDNCEIVGPTVTTTSNYRALIYSSGSNNNRWTISNSGLRNGSMGMYLR